MAGFEMFRCFQDGMILQRNAKVNIWGFAQNGKILEMEMLGLKYEATADENGEFIFSVNTCDAGGPYEIHVWSDDEEIIIKDVLFGDVYIISGQSNMQLTNERTIDIIGERLDNIDYPMIREFRVPEQIAFGKQMRQFSDGKWLRAVRHDILDMSATGFNFAENIYKNHKIPIGLINNSIGGTRIEAHLPEKLLHTYGKYDEIIEKCKDESYVSRVQKSELDEMDRWYKKLEETDPGKIGGKEVYAEEGYNDSTWNTMNVPCFFAETDLENHHGSVWIRREFELPENYNTEGALLRLGVLIDGDETFINGVMVGKVDYKYPPRRFPVPAGVLKPGRNVVTIRLIINRDTGGFTMGKRYCLQGKEYIYEGGYRGEAAMPENASPESGRWEINLEGTWKYIKGASLDILSPTTFFQYKPSALFNGMMHPLLKYNFKGGLWYQGESNDGDPVGYEALLKDLIKCWRTWFGENLPFMYVQLPSYDDPSHLVDEDSWAIIREEQRLVMKDIDNVGMAVTIDKGEGNDLHPQTKDIVGMRLALAAEMFVYGSNNEYSGPFPEGIKYCAEKGSVSILFSHCAHGIKLVNNNLNYFEIGYLPELDSYTEIDKYDARITWVEAADVNILSDNEIKVTLPEQYKLCVDPSVNGDGLKPVSIRYAWSCAPEFPPLYNGAGLPATPFLLKL